MPRRNKRQIKYGRNPVPRRLSYGRKMRDDYGGWTYEDKLVEDAFGNRTSPERHAPDTDEYRH